MKKSLLIMLVSLLCYSLNAANTNDNGRKIVIRGTVKDCYGTPVPGARIFVDGKSSSTYTNENGRFRIKVNSNTSTLGIISFGGGLLIDSLRKREIINFVLGSNINVQPPEDINALRPPINMGYSLIRSSDVTSSTRYLNPKKNKRHYQSVTEMIDELVKIGSTPLNLFGASGPLIVVNGMVAINLDDIQPDLVESITYIKDGAAAIYGSRAFGGVVLIKTKVNLLDQ